MRRALGAITATRDGVLSCSAARPLGVSGVAQPPLAPETPPFHLIHQTGKMRRLCHE